MDFKPTMPDPQMRVYCEDTVASDFLRYILKRYIDDADEYFDFQEINFGWTNYVTLLEKNAFKVRDSLIMLDADVPAMKDYRKHKSLIENSDNVVILPVLVEEGLFRLLKDRNNYSIFLRDWLQGKDFPYEICFSEWLNNSDYYKANEPHQFKHWYKHATKNIETHILYDFWLSRSKQDFDDFIVRFIAAYNKLADRLKLDPLPDIEEVGDIENTEVIP